ncbi:MAG: dihydroorotase [Lachnospiraceae bacterium]|nr:dihydroorotase [Lachnospiraceae bacterium]
MNILIRNARIMNPHTGSDSVGDILISDGKIARIASPGNPVALPDDTRIIEADRLVAAPGLVDVHVHFREPGFTHKEDIATGAMAAAAGGYTTVVMMANTKPVVDSPAILTQIMERIRQVTGETPLHILPTASVTQGLEGLKLTDFAALSALGAAGFTDDGIPVMDEVLLRKAFETAAALGRPVSLHEEDPRLISQNGINAGAVSAHFHLKGSPREAEISMIRRDLAIAGTTSATVNIQHISTKEGVELIRQAKRSNPGIHAEATPHHFSLTEEAVLKHGTLAKMNPPLRTEEDRLAIVEGLSDGTIDIIATDHAPHSAEEKARGLTEAPSGIIGLETALSLGITNLVMPGHLTLMQLLEKMTTGPASLYGRIASIEEGRDADLVLFDPEAVRTVRRFYSKSSNSPFIGETLRGVVKYTICNGRISYSDPEI